MINYDTHLINHGIQAYFSDKLMFVLAGGRPDFGIRLINISPLNLGLFHRNILSSEASKIKWQCVFVCFCCLFLDWLIGSTHLYRMRFNICSSFPSRYTGRCQASSLWGRETWTAKSAIDIDSDNPCRLLHVRKMFFHLVNLFGKFPTVSRFKIITVFIGSSCIYCGII